MAYLCHGFLERNDESYRGALVTGMRWSDLMASERKALKEMIKGNLKQVENDEAIKEN